jgi:hypothetical protein
MVGRVQTKEFAVVKNYYKPNSLLYKQVGSEKSI